MKSATTRVASGTPDPRHSSLKSGVIGILGGTWTRCERPSAVVVAGHGRARVVLAVLLRRDRETEAARTSLARLLGEFHVPETVCTDNRVSFPAAIRAVPTLEAVDHQQVISTVRCTESIEQAHQGNKSGTSVVSRAQANPGGCESPRSGHQPSTLYPNDGSRPYQKKQAAVQMWREVGAAQGWTELQSTPALHLLTARFT